MNQDKDKGRQLIRNSTAEFLIFTGQAGEQSIEARYEDETVWLTQQLMAELFQSSKQNISHHIKSIYEEGELQPEATVKKYLTVRQEGKRQVKRELEYYNLDMFLEFDDREILQDSGKVTARLAKTHAGDEFEKYRIVQDRLFESDFDRVIKQLEEKDEEDE